MAGGPSSGPSIVTAFAQLRGSRSPLRSQPGRRCLSHLKQSRASRDELCSQPRSGAPSHSAGPTPSAPSARPRPLVTPGAIPPLHWLPAAAAALAAPRPLPARTQSACQHRTSSLSHWLSSGPPVTGPPPLATLETVQDYWPRGELKGRRPSTSPCRRLIQWDKYQWF